MNERIDLIAAELVLMAEIDQQVLQILSQRGEIKDGDYHPRMRTLHEEHTRKLQRIIRQCGWPTKSLVGETASQAAWLILQHSATNLAFMKSCLPLLQQAVRSGELDHWQIAFLQNHILTLSSAPQIYGTQRDLDTMSWPTKRPIHEAATSLNTATAALTV